MWSGMAQACGSMGDLQLPRVLLFGDPVDRRRAYTGLPWHGRDGHIHGTYGGENMGCLTPVVFRLGTLCVILGASGFGTGWAASCYW